jgi:hypothetical protein
LLYVSQVVAALDLLEALVVVGVESQWVSFPLLLLPVLLVREVLEEVPHHKSLVEVTEVAHLTGTLLLWVVREQVELVIILVMVWLMVVPEAVQEIKEADKAELVLLEAVLVAQ